MSGEAFPVAEPVGFSPQPSASECSQFRTTACSSMRAEAARTGNWLGLTARGSHRANWTFDVAL